VKAVWVADSRPRTIAIHRPAAEPLVLREGDTLTDGEIIPGFALPVADAFRE
jgi:hypothetical protein